MNALQDSRTSAAYGRSVRSALICQVICVLLALTILDLGEFAVRFLLLSLFFWVAAFVFMYRRRHPTLIERLIVGAGPMIIFWTMFLLG